MVLQENGGGRKGKNPWGLVNFPVGGDQGEPTYREETITDGERKTTETLLKNQKTGKGGKQWAVLTG